MKRFSLLLIAVIGIGCAPRSTPSTRQAPDSEIIGKLEELVALEERVLESQQLRYEHGEIDGTVLLASKSALAEARLDLAEERGDPEAMAGELEAVVASARELLAREEALAEEGLRTRSDLGRLHADVLKAELRLLRHRRKAATAP